ncbi:MAG: cyclic nucleotide-binding domain-containing protein [Xanthomonadales bacterium]|nr:cyclic nucleotide-binding domain-containing protein [Xanthomonadales bacterium]
MATDDKKHANADQPTTIAQIDAEQTRQEVGYRDALVRKLIKAAVHDEVEALQIEKEVESGGVGAINIAFEANLQRRVAVKSLKRASYAEPMLVRGFLREAQIIAQLEHPNIVAVHRLEDSPEVGVHFSMGLVDGRNLSDMFNEQAAPDYDGMIDLLRVLGRVCDALEYAHSRGVVHCDVKPANIMVGEFGRVYLMDWGGARLMDGTLEEAESGDWVRDRLPELPDEEARDLVFGTPSYMAPEQALGKPVDGRTDVFAIGAILYRFIAGHAPFASESPNSSLRMAQSSSFKLLEPGEFAGILPDKLFAITHKAMASDPDERYASIGELRKDIQSILRGGGALPKVSFGAGEVIIREGDDGDAGYIIVRGEVSLHRDIDGKQIEIGRLGPGEVFGETAIFASTPRTASVIAESDVKLIKIDSEVIHGELKTMKPWMAAFVRVLARRFEESEFRRLKGG